MSGHERRRAFRLPANTSCDVTLAGEKLTCVLSEVSILGLTLVGNSLAQAQRGDALTVDRIDPGSAPVAVAIDGRVVRVAQGDSEIIVGIEIVPSDNVTTRQRFLEAVYMPLYSKFGADDR